jgi:hypothetical protein
MKLWHLILMVSAMLPHDLHAEVKPRMTVQRSGVWDLVPSSHFYSFSLTNPFPHRVYYLAVADTGLPYHREETRKFGRWRDTTGCWGVDTLYTWRSLPARQTLRFQSPYGKSFWPHRLTVTLYATPTESALSTVAVSDAFQPR